MISLTSGESRHIKSPVDLFPDLTSGGAISLEVNVGGSFVPVLTLVEPVKFSPKIGTEYRVTLTGAAKCYANG